MTELQLVSDMLGTFCNQTVADSDIDFNILVETSAVVRSKTVDTSSD